MHIEYSMEILILVLLYYLSQNPAFAESVKPLMGKIKDSEQMLNFLNDLSKFSSAFSCFSGNDTAPKPNADCKDGAPPNGKKADAYQNGGTYAPSTATGENPSADKEEKSPQSPTAGIADEFIQNILDSYLKKK